MRVPPIEDHWEIEPGQLESTHEQCLPRTDSFVRFVPFVVKRKDANSVGASLDISYFSAYGSSPTPISISTARLFVLLFSSLAILLLLVPIGVGVGIGIGIGIPTVYCGWSSHTVTIGPAEMRDRCTVHIRFLVSKPHSPVPFSREPATSSILGGMVPAPSVHNWRSRLLLVPIGIGVGIGIGIDSDGVLWLVLTHGAASLPDFRQHRNDAVQQCLRGRVPCIRLLVSKSHLWSFDSDSDSDPDPDDNPCRDRDAFVLY
jgi:hypothetical protein